MAKLTPEQFQEKHARRLTASLEDIRLGVSQVQVSPTVSAAAKKDKMRAGILQAIDSGKWEAGLKRVTVDDWKKAMLEKGVDRIPAGIDGAKSKVIAFANDLLPHIEKGQAKLAKLPDVTIQDSINRAAAWIKHMYDMKRTA